MNKYTRWYKKHIDTFPPNKYWFGPSIDYIEMLDIYKDYVVREIDKFTTIHKATDVCIEIGQSGYNMNAAITDVGEMTEEEKLQQDKNDKDIQDIMDNAKKTKLKELIKKYPEVAKEAIGEENYVIPSLHQ